MKSKHTQSTLKRGIFLLLLMGATLLYTQLASAQTFGQFQNGLESAISLILGDISGISNVAPGEVFFIKILVFILLFALIGLILQRIPQFEDNWWIRVIVSLTVSLIAIRFMTTEALINFVWLPYGTIGIVISVTFPFILGFFFVEGLDSSIIRRVFWIAFLIIFIALAAMRWNDLSVGTLWYQNLAWIYAIIAVLSGLLLLFDTRIRTLFIMSSFRGIDDVNKRVDAARLSHEIEQDRQLLGTTQSNAHRTAIERRIRQKERSLKAILRS